MDNKFYNNKKSVDLIKKIIKSTYNFSNAVYLTGLKGTGKTLLLKELETYYKDEYLIFNIDLSNLTYSENIDLTRLNILKLFYNEILKVGIEYNLVDFKKVLLEEFREVNIIVDKFYKDTGLPVPYFNIDTQYGVFSEFIMELPILLYEKYKACFKGLLIFVDDFPNLNYLDECATTIFTYFKFILGNYSDVTYVLAGETYDLFNFLVKMDASGLHFNNIYLNANLEPFTYVETVNFIKYQFKSLKFTDNALKLFYKYTMGLPAYINAFTYFLPKNTLINESKIKREIKENKDFLLSIFKNHWKNLNENDKKILKILIEKPETKEELLSKSNLKEEKFYKSLTKLLYKRFIRYNGNKYEIINYIIIWYLEKE